MRCFTRYAAIFHCRLNFCEFLEGGVFLIVSVDPEIVVARYIEDLLEFIGERDQGRFQDGQRVGNITG